jgi:hypothetical protein
VKLLLHGPCRRVDIHLCSTIFLHTPIRSEEDQAKTSLFLSKKDRISVSSDDERSFPMSTVLFGTLGSNATCFVLHYVSITVLASLGASAFTGQISC